jgi:type VI protein secretion system component VasF
MSLRSEKSLTDGEIEALIERVAARKRRERIERFRRWTLWFFGLTTLVVTVVGFFGVSP